MNCTYLDQYRGQWWDLVHRIISLGIPQKCTLTRRATASLSIGTLLYGVIRGKQTETHTA